MSAAVVQGTCMRPFISSMEQSLGRQAKDMIVVDECGCEAHGFLLFRCCVFARCGAWAEGFVVMHLNIRL